jgi:hypothetical protein
MGGFSPVAQQTPSSTHVKPSVPWDESMQTHPFPVSGLVSALIQIAQYFFMSPDNSSDIWNDLDSVVSGRYGWIMCKNPYAAITDAQKKFVLDSGADLDNRGWAVDYRQNLFAPLHTDSALDFEVAGELATSGGGRIAAPHSSTALAINMFDVWRDRSPEPLSDAILSGLNRIVGYELQHGFGFRRGAQPDIEFAARGGARVAVEVKFREPYGTVTNEFADRYFDTPGLWDGLPNLRELAVSIRDGDTTFTTLHAAQLIKHALGLTHSCGTNFVLGYLWHHLRSKTGDAHIAQLAEFTTIVSEDIDFAPVTVTELVDRFDPERADAAWLGYMTARYVEPFTSTTEHAEEEI